MHTAGRLLSRSLRAVLVVTALIVLAPAMNLVMATIGTAGAVAGVATRPTVAVAATVAERVDPAAEQPSGSPLRLVQKARGVLASDLILADTSVGAVTVTPTRVPHVCRSVAVPAAPRTACQPHRGPPSAVPHAHHRRPHRHL